MTLLLHYLRISSIGLSRRFLKPTQAGSSVEPRHFAHGGAVRLGIQSA